MPTKDELIEQLHFMIETIPEEQYRITIDAIKLFFSSLITFGPSSNQIKQSLNVIKEMSKILKEENYLLNLILSNIDHVDLEEASDIIDSLDILNEKTYMSYDDILYQIEISLELKNSKRALRSVSGIDSLITNGSYKKQVLELIKKEA